MVHHYIQRAMKWSTITYKASSLREGAARFAASSSSRSAPARAVACASTRAMQKSDKFEHVGALQPTTIWEDWKSHLKLWHSPR